MEQAIQATTFAKKNATRNWSQVIFSGEMKFGWLSSWGCYSNNETTDLFFFTGALDSSKYLKIIELVLPTTNNKPKENVAFMHVITYKYLLYEFYYHLHFAVEGHYRC